MFVARIATEKLLLEMFSVNVLREIVLPCGGEIAVLALEGLLVHCQVGAFVDVQTPQIVGLVRASIALVLRLSDFYRRVCSEMIFLLHGAVFYFWARYL